MHFSFPKINSLICIGAHADDIEIGCGGTLMRLIAEQPEMKVTWCVFSAGGQRRAEAIKCAEQILEPVTDKAIEVLNFRDGYFQADFERIKEALVAIGQKASPDLVLTHRTCDLHQDHRLLGELSWQVFRESQILQYEIPKYDGDLGNPNVYISISERVAASKIDLLAEHFQSQHAKPWYREQTFRALLTIRGIESHSPSGLAEAFYARKITI